MLLTDTELTDFFYDVYGSDFNEFMKRLPLSEEQFVSMIEAYVVSVENLRGLRKMNSLLKTVIGSAFQAGYMMGERHGRRVDESTEQVDLAGGI
jgi:hypothetical protein